MDTMDTMTLEFVRACQIGDLEAVKRLHIGGMVDIDYLNGWPLRCAGVSGSLGVVEYLVENGADIHAGDDRPLREARRNGHTNVVEYLLSVIRKEKLDKLLI